MSMTKLLDFVRKRRRGSLLFAVRSFLNTVLLAQTSAREIRIVPRGRAYTVGKNMFGAREFPMKSRWLAIAMAMATFSVGPWTFAQVQDQDKDQPKSGDVQNAPAPAPAALPTQDDSQIKHDGTKKDVDAVGSRNVGCGRGVGNWYSVESQVAQGRKYAQQIESQIKLVDDPVVTEYVNRIGQNLVRNSDAQVPFTIKVIDSDVVNAMALPGGFFYVNSGLLLAADEEAEMAGVMAHEIAHVAACHYGREMTQGAVVADVVDSVDHHWRTDWLRSVRSVGAGDPHDLPEVLPRLRVRGRLSGRGVYVPRWI